MDLRLSQAGRSNHIRRECLTFRRSTGGATTHIPTVAGRIAHTVVNMHPEPSRWPGLVAFTIGARGSADFRHGGVGGLFDQLRDVLIRVFAGKWFAGREGAQLVCGSGRCRLGCCLAATSGRRRSAPN